jgi:ubiquinol-cytochrome c reductase iron-sulfur subunit
MSRAKDALVAALVLLLGRGRPRRGVRIVPAGSPNRGAETIAIALLFAASGCALGFVVLYALDANTQLLGLTLGGALVCLAASLIVVAHKLIVTEQLVAEYPPPEHPHEQDVLVEIVEESGDRLTRRRLFRLGLLAAGGGLGLAAIVPALSFGPLLRTRYFYGTPWRRGRRLVDEHDRPLKAADLEEKAFYTAFAEGANKEEQGAPLILVRLPVSALRLPPELAGYDAEGIVAYSKVCTHAGCAVAMYRAPLYAPDEPRPALVCPCHYSTFDPADGGSVTFGPAGRALPMLPLTIDGNGFLRAKGDFNGPVGPSWWGVRE